jgi:hypothetical protein
MFFFMYSLMSFTECRVYDEFSKSIFCIVIYPLFRLLILPANIIIKQQIKAVLNTQHIRIE